MGDATSWLSGLYRKGCVRDDDRVNDDEGTFDTCTREEAPCVIAPHFTLTSHVSEKQRAILLLQV